MFRRKGYSGNLEAVQMSNLYLRVQGSNLRSNGRADKHGGPYHRDKYNAIPRKFK